MPSVTCHRKLLVCQIPSRNSVCIVLVSKYLIFSPPFITKCFSSVPYLLVATQVWLPSRYSLLLRVFVVFITHTPHTFFIRLVHTLTLIISTAKFRFNAMYMGGVPMAEHVTWLPGSTLTEVSEKILGGTDEEIFNSVSPVISTY